LDALKQSHGQGLQHIEWMVKVEMLEYLLVRSMCQKGVVP
jgi:hypothetical protein